MVRLEDGITQATKERLLSRKDNLKVNNWDTLWLALFGDGVPVKDSSKLAVNNFSFFFIVFLMQCADRLHQALSLRLNWRKC